MNSAIPHNGTRKRSNVWGNKRVWLFIALVIVLSIALVAMANIRQNIAQYGDKTPNAIPSTLCAGDKFTYPVHVEIKDPETVVVLTEDWCRVGTNICSFDSQPKAHNILDPSVVDSTATRSVPADIPPGDWQFRHCNTSITSGRPIDVTCYGVNVTILPEEACKDKP